MPETKSDILEDLHIVVDIETLGTTPGCAILSIGAVAFSPNALILPELESRYWEISKHPGFADNDTLEFWKEQGKTAWGWVQDLNLGIRGKNCVPVYQEFRNVLHDWRAKALLVDCKTWFWSRGHFDYPLLKHWLDYFGWATPWEYGAVRDIRSFMMAFPELSRMRAITPHHALSDASADASNLLKCFSVMNARKVGPNEAQ